MKLNFNIQSKIRFIRNITSLFLTKVLSMKYFLRLLLPLASLSMHFLFFYQQIELNFSKSQSTPKKNLFFTLPSHFMVIMYRNATLSIDDPG